MYQYRAEQNTPSPQEEKDCSLSPIQITWMLTISGSVTGSAYLIENGHNLVLLSFQIAASLITTLAVALRERRTGDQTWRIW